MLEPEIESGNIEYKRFLKNVNKKRLFELVTQLNWRLNEGDGVCYYYIGVDDDGSIYNISCDEIKSSINTLKIMAKECNSSIVKTKKKKENYYIVTLKKNWCINKYNEYRVLFIGDTNTYKTTVLARLIKGKNNKNYIVNHKHEIESGNTSSINYYTLEDGNNRFLLFDSPGNKKYIKKLLKIVQSIDYNLVIFF